MSTSILTSATGSVAVNGPIDLYMYVVTPFTVSLQLKCGSSSRSLTCANWLWTGTHQKHCRNVEAKVTTLHCDWSISDTGWMLTTCMPWRSWQLRCIHIGAFFCVIRVDSRHYQWQQSRQWRVVSSTRWSCCNKQQAGHAVVLHCCRMATWQTVALTHGGSVTWHRVKHMLIFMWENMPRGAPDGEKNISCKWPDH
jgi:hypothetical protein